jgi:precorrin-2 methylase
MSAAGKLVGVGVGPGDPELITLKAVRVLEQADVVVHFAKSGTTGNARAIAQRYLRPGIRELPLTFPVTTPISMTAAWSPWSARAIRCSTAPICICMSAWQAGSTPR